MSDMNYPRNAWMILHWNIIVFYLIKELNEKKTTSIDTENLSIMSTSIQNKNSSKTGK